MGRHWYVDITYTLTRNDVTGITKTVRRLCTELKVATSEHHDTCTPIIFHSTGFRLAPDGALSSIIKTESTSGSRSFSFFNSIFSGKYARSLITLSLKLFPWKFLKYPWIALSQNLFNANSRLLPRIEFQSNDVLLLIDASWNYPSWRTARKARKQGAKVVTLIYDLMPIRHPNYCFPLLPHQFQSWLSEMATCSDALVCISKATKDDVLSWVKQNSLSASPENPRIGYFHLGVDPDSRLADFDVRPMIKNFLSSGEPCFASVGSFEEKRNYSFVLQVFDEFWNKGKKTRLILAGRATAEYAEFLERIKAHPHLHKNLLVLHDATDAEISYLYQNCRCLIMASSFEGFGLPLIEARTKGAIVLASDIPAFKEIGDEGVFYFDLQDTDSFKSILLHHINCDLKKSISPMQPVSWRESANTLLNTVDNLLSPER